MSKEVIEYVVPLNDEEKCKKTNEEWGTNFRSTEEHVMELMEKLYDGIEKVGEEGGFYLGDTIKVKIELEYVPEDK